MKKTRGPGRRSEIPNEDKCCESRTLSMPRKLWKLVELVQQDRMDSSLSATVKTLLLRSLGQMQYLSEEEKKAAGIP